MKLNFDVSVEDIKNNAAARSEMSNLIDAFVKSGSEAAEIEWKGGYRSASSCSNSVKKMLKNANSPCDVVTRKNKVYLIKK